MGVQNVGPYLGKIRHTVGFKFKHVFLLVLLMLGVLLAQHTPLEDYVGLVFSGIVWNNDGCVVDSAVIRAKDTRNGARFDRDGRLSPRVSVPSDMIRVTLGKNGHHVEGASFGHSGTSIEATPNPYRIHDNKDYRWLPPAIETRSAFEEFLIQTSLSLAASVSVDRLFHPLAKRLPLGCGDCHREIYGQWAGSVHALGARNARFLTMYNGTDVAGNQSPLTRYAYRGNCRLVENYGLIGQYVRIGRTSRQVQSHRRNYGAPLRPDPNLPYYGPGYKLDFPQTDGNCAACHLPGVAIGNPYGIDPNQTVGTDAQGSHCDICHKIAAVKLDSVTGLPCENMPGVLSIKFARPGSGSPLFFGTYDDADVGTNTYHPPMKESEICAPCHQASFWGVPIYDSFREWLASPYPAQGKTCQSCHMKPNGVMVNFAPGRGGLERDPGTVSTHGFPGAADHVLLQDAVTMDVCASHQDGSLKVSVTITNDKAGHHVPTGSPLRHLILLVEAVSPDQIPLAYLDGPTVPDWCGVGTPAQGCYSGLPGRAYAKVLQEWWTEMAPTGAYWNKTRLLSDNRIAAFAADTSLLSFDAEGHEEVTVNVKLLYRRAFVSLQRQKGWNDPDIVLGQKSLTVRQPYSLHALREEDSR